VTRSNADLRLGPGIVQVGKAGLTRVRSVRWLLAGGSEKTPKDDGLRILVYHRVTSERDRLAVTPSRFREHVGYLSAAGYRLVDVEEGSRLALEGQASRVIALSFDDGYRDVAENAAPVLQDYGAAATVFVVPGVVDGRARFTWYASQPPLLSWDDIVRLDRASPFRFGAHSLTHPNLTALDADSAEREIVGSKMALEARLGREVETFCYPAGLYGVREQRIAAAAGFRVAVTCEPGVNLPDTDIMAYRRTAIESHDRLIDLRAKVAGAHDTPLPLRRFYRRMRHGVSGD
jgi:peptidoglycan/xylan/chitin deacetylase (PgdA/CDA1 family)